MECLLCASIVIVTRRTQQWTKHTEKVKTKKGVFILKNDLMTIKTHFKIPQ